MKEKIGRMCRGIFTGEGGVRTIQKSEGNNNTKHFEKALSTHIILCFLRKCLCVLKWNFILWVIMLPAKSVEYLTQSPTPGWEPLFKVLKTCWSYYWRRHVFWIQDLEELRLNYVEPYSLSTSSQTSECINQTSNRENQERKIIFLPSCNVYEQWPEWENTSKDIITIYTLTVTTSYVTDSKPTL